jgi:Zn-dependent protease
VTVLLAGPLTSFLVAGLLWALPAVLPFPAFLRERHWESPVATGLVLLFIVNVVWGALNLLPLWPFDGGRIACEVGEGLLGRSGVVPALVLSLVTVLVLTLGVLWWARTHLTNRYDPRYTLYLGYSLILLLYCFALWLSSFRALWGPAPAAAGPGPSAGPPEKPA